MDPQWQALVQEFEERVWSCAPANPPSGEDRLLAGCRQIGARIEDLLSEQSDETLALAVQMDFFRRGAFEELLPGRYQHRLYRWFHGRGTAPDLAGDLVQEMYLKLYRDRLRKYDPTGPFGAYLFVASRNLWIDKVVRPQSERTPGHLDQVACLCSPLEDKAVAELQERIDKGMSSLPEGYRKVLEQSMGGAQPEEIGSRLGLPLATVYRKLFRARQRLAEILGIPRPRSNRTRTKSTDPTVGERRSGR
jgi:RNA polymerase sigma factor (sigma-70 family)